MGFLPEQAQGWLRYNAASVERARRVFLDVEKQSAQLTRALPTTYAYLSAFFTGRGQGPRAASGHA